MSVHLFAWLTFLFLPLLVGPPGSTPPLAVRTWMLLSHGCMVLMLAGFYYLNNAWLAPRYLLRGRTGRYTLIVLGLFIVYIACYAAMSARIEHVRSLSDTPRMPMPRGGFMQLVPAIIFFAVIELWSTTQSLAEAYRRLRESREASERSHLQIELDHLRSQVDPHFFFNALNTIYGLAELKDERTAQATLHLSRLMRHTLEAPRMGLIPLTAEVEHLRAYISFQQLRSAGSPVEFTVTGIAAGMNIAPLLLVPLVENAFKHGPTSTNEAPTTIDIIGYDEGKLSLVVTNAIAPELQRGDGRGLGLVNLRRRLALEYPGAHTLTAVSEGQRFRASMYIDLYHAVHSA